VWAPVISRLAGVSPQNFFQVTCREARVIKWVKLLEGLPPKIWEGEKTSKIQSAFWQLSTLIANIFGTDRHIAGKVFYQPEPLRRLVEKITWTSVHKQKSYRGSYWPTQADILRETTFRPLGGGGAAPSNCYTRYRCETVQWPWNMPNMVNL